MSARIVIRQGIVLLFALLLSGCFGGGSPPGRQVDRGGDCRWDRSRCLYEGSYEPGERDYAEQKAKDLNRASLEKLRRGSRW